MTIVPSIDQFDEFYVFNTFDNFDNYLALKITVTATDPNINSLLINSFPAVLSWKLANLNDGSFYFFKVINTFFHFPDPSPVQDAVLTL